MRTERAVITSHDKLLSRLPIDPYIAAIGGMVLLASALPGTWRAGMSVAGHITTAANCRAH